MKKEEILAGLRLVGRWILSLLPVGVVLALCFWGISLGGLPWERERYPVVLLGDSIIGNAYDGEGIAAYLEDLLGEPVFKGGFGGSCATYEAEEVVPSSIAAQLSLVKLSEAIAYRDFSVQKAQIAYGDNYRYILSETADYFSSAIEGLSRVDFNGVDYLLIEHGTNDYNTGRRLDNPEDPYDVGTFGGALRYSIELLRKAYPDLSILLMTPTWCYLVRDGQRVDCRDLDLGGGRLEEYVNLELEIAGDYGLPCLDNYHDFVIGWDTQDQYLVDGLHLNREGQQLLAERIAGFLSQVEEQEILGQGVGTDLDHVKK